MAPLTEVVKVNTEKMLSGSDQVPVGGSVPSEQGSGAGVLGKDDYDYDEDLW